MMLAKCVALDNGCIVWTGYRNPAGYGQLRVNYKLWLAHRYAAHVAGWDIEGRAVHHRCHNPACVNLDHLEVSETHSDHMREHHARHPTHCPQGHEYTVENTYVVRRSNGKQERACKSCYRKRSNERYHALTLEQKRERAAKARTKRHEYVDSD